MKWLQRITKQVLPYKSKKDYCTLWPDCRYGDCCMQHDDDYKYGEVTKQEADEYLKDCVCASGYPKTSWWIFRGVSVFGWVPWYNHRRRNLKRDEVQS